MCGTSGNATAAAPATPVASAAAMASPQAIVQAVYAEGRGYIGQTFSVTRTDQRTDDGKTSSRTLRYEGNGPQAGWRQLDSATTVRQASFGSNAPPEGDLAKMEPPRGYGTAVELLKGPWDVVSQTPDQLVVRLRSVPDAVFNDFVLGAGPSVIGELVIDTTGRPFIREVRVSNPAPFKARTKYGVQANFKALQVRRAFERAPATGIIYPTRSKFTVQARALFISVDQVNELTFTDFGPLVPMPAPVRRG